MTLRLRHPYQPQHNPGSARNASAVASFDASKFSQRPVSASLKVGIPLYADAPAPVKTTMCLATRRYFAIVVMGIAAFLNFLLPRPGFLRRRRTLSGHWTCRSADGCRKPSHSVSARKASILTPTAGGLRAPLAVSCAGQNDACSALDEMIRLVNVHFDILEEPGLLRIFPSAARFADTRFPLPKKDVFMLAFEQGGEGGLL